VRRLSIALVHHPVLDAKNEVVTSTLTTMDVHDLSRSARTYGCERFYIVHPIPAQRALGARIIDHWTHGSSAKRIPDRKDALAIVTIVSTLEDAVNDMTRDGASEEDRARVWVTAARTIGPSMSWSDARAELSSDGPPLLLVFGTSWGLAPAVVEGADALLAPIHGTGEWNHLSVRAACAIALDRLAGC
jgi:hypothetical protein